MKIVSSYKAKVVEPKNELSLTIDYFCEAVEYLADVFHQEWMELENYNEHDQFNFAERYVHSTKNHKAKYDFDLKFPNVPSYFRRSAIKSALGLVSSYATRFEQWFDSGQIGNPPKMSEEDHPVPAFYNEGMSKCDSMLTGCENIIKLKLYDGKKWKWHDIKLRKQDVKYIFEHWQGAKASAPVLIKKRNKYHLVFSFKENVKLSEIDKENKIVMGVDLGINTSATCSVMNNQGTILARKFIDFPNEKDRINHLLNKIKGCQQKHGSKQGGKREWRQYNGLAVNVH